MQTCSGGQNQAPPMRSPAGTVTQRKGRATWSHLVAILQGLKVGPKNLSMSMAKPSKVIQRGNESPSEFYERLCEACILYTSIDPEAVGSQMVINAAFVFQAYPENVRWGDIK